jgi:murein DD-endopeptidase MepM/ murein hydrolase activator NlpD
MKSDARKTVGNVLTSDKRRSAALLVSAFILLFCGPVFAQAMYKYRGSDGEWVFTDRAPQEGPDTAEVRDLPTGIKNPEVNVRHRLAGPQIQLYASNEFLAPVELILALDELEGVELPPPDQSLRWVLPPRSETELLQLDALDDDAAPPYVSYRFVYLYGDPDAVHSIERPYRAPFATARRFMVSQTFPIGITHVTPDSYYAVDIEMPIGTDIYAARGGTVVEVASTNYRSSPDPEEEGASANLVRIMHDDGTFGVYAHLNWNTIRVRPGDRVARGEYIADSGNTGFSTGPHLHFAVLVNRGMRLESLPIVFEGSNGVEVMPAYQEELIAY